MGGKRRSKTRRQSLQELNASPKAGFKCSPNGLKAQRNKAQVEAMKLRAEVERLHQQLGDAVADYQLLQADMEQVQAARKKLQGEYEALDQLAEERNHAIQLLQRDKCRLSYELRNVRRCRPIAPRLTRHQQQLLNILMRHRVSPEVLQRCAEGGYGRLDTHGNPTGCAFQQPSPTANPPNFIPTQSDLPVCASPPASCLLELPDSVLDNIASWAVRPGASGALSLTCRAFAQANLRHAPAFRIQFDRQRCDQLLTPRIVAIVRARTGKLVSTLEQPHALDSGQYAEILAHVLDKLGSCAAVDAVKLSSSGAPHFGYTMALTNSPGLAQRLLDSFPGLTAMALYKYTITCSHLAGLLSHPQLALQLQQLDLTGTSIRQAQQPNQPGAVTLAILFQGLRLKRLSLAIYDIELLPDLQPLAQHLTQLQWTELPNLPLRGTYPWVLGLRTQSRLQVLTVCNPCSLWGLLRDLQALPQLHTLQLAETTLRNGYELDDLLAATQLTSVQLASVEGLSSSRASAPCSWQRLELTGSIDCTSAAHLPLHSLTQPLVLGELCCSVDLVTTPEAAAALHSLAGAWKQPPVVRCVQLDMFGRLEEEAKAQVEAAPEEADTTPLVRIILQQQSSRWEQLVALLCTLELRCVDKVVISNFLVFSAADVQVLAPFCHGCTCLHFLCSSICPSLEFWHQLVQSMPSVTNVLFTPLQEPASVAMHESLQLMAEQPWARWLDITISFKHPEEVTYWQAQDWSSIGGCKRWLTPIKPYLQHLAAASSAGTSLVANLKHITVTLATWDGVWEVYLDPKWARQRLRLYGAQDRALEQFYKQLEEDMAEVSMERHRRAKQLVVFCGAAIALALGEACCKVVCRPRGSDQRRGRMVLVDEHRTTRVSSAVKGKQPCEEELDHEQPTRLPPRKPPQAICSSQEATPAAASEPGPSTPPPAKRSKRTEAEHAAEPTQPTTAEQAAELSEGKAAEAKPAPQPGRWLDSDYNAAQNMQRIGESKWRPLELCWWPDQGALPAKGKE
ncbi:hypothetical protein QJQ45_010521 [Haematococcus lacustris]|nr:hypothetical protein QJQ45_010521 [Haematococcus lacustris]